MPMTSMSSSDDEENIIRVQHHQQQQQQQQQHHHPELPPMQMNNDEYGTPLHQGQQQGQQQQGQQQQHGQPQQGQPQQGQPQQGQQGQGQPQGVTPISIGIKRDLDSISAHQTAAAAQRNSHSKKPRDNRLRDCFIITPLEGGGENIICKHCPDYNKTLQKFNPTKSRAHLTTQCVGVDETLRQILLDTTQAARKSSIMNNGSGQHDADGGVAGAGGGIGGGKVEARWEGSNDRRHKKTKTPRNRISPAYISFHTEDTSLDVTAPIENGEAILRLAFPTDNLKLNFLAKTGTEAAAMCIDGFMNMKTDASWTASMCSMTVDGTRAGPHCQWSLNDNGENASRDDGVTRLEKVEKLLKTMAMI